MIVTRRRVVAVATTVVLLVLANTPLTQAEVPAPGENPPLGSVPELGASLLEPSPGRELVDERTATSRTYETAIPGVFLTQTFPSRVNYEDTSGEWEEIDSSLVAVEDGTFTNAADSLEVSLSGSASAETIATLELGAGSAVGFGLEGAADVAPQVNADTAVYDGAVPGVDLSLQSLPTGIKELITLSSPDSPREFVFPLSVDGLRARDEADGAVTFVDASGNARLAIPPGFMVDSSSESNPVTGSGAYSSGVDYQLEDEGRALRVRLDNTWLSDPARVFPIMVDPTLHVVSDSDDTYVTQGITANSSAQYVLKAGFDGSHANRSFMHFAGLDEYADMNIMEADLAVWQNGAGSCSASPLDVYLINEPWTGASTTTWPGPAIGSSPIGTITSGAGHDGSCPGGFASADITRAVVNWSVDLTTWTSNGLALVARDESAAAQFKQLGSSESYVPPTVNVLWSDPNETSSPELPTSLSPEYYTDTASPVLSATYTDSQSDSGQIVFFAYDAVSGAFLGGYPSSTVTSGSTASYTGSSFPIDYPLIWRALPVDLVHGVAGPMSNEMTLVRPSVRVTAPTNFQNLSGAVTVSAAVDTSITNATSVQFLFDGAVVATDSSAPYTYSHSTAGADNGNHTYAARIVGGSYDQRASQVVDVTIDNGGAWPAQTEGSYQHPLHPVPWRGSCDIVGAHEDVYSDEGWRAPRSITLTGSGSHECGTYRSQLIYHRNPVSPNLLVTSWVSGDHYAYPSPDHWPPNDRTQYTVYSSRHAKGGSRSIIHTIGY